MDLQGSNLNWSGIAKRMGKVDAEVCNMQSPAVKQGALPHSSAPC